MIIPFKKALTDSIFLTVLIIIGAIGNLDQWLTFVKIEALILTVIWGVYLMYRNNQKTTHEQTSFRR